jgi:glycosyl transferase family 25
MRAVFINLDRATERRVFMERQAERLGLAFERVAAVEASGISDSEVARLGRSWERPLTRAELGCFLSHQGLWLEAASGEAPMLVMEDDIVLSPRLPELLPVIAALEGVEFLNLESFGRRRFVGRGARRISQGAALLRLHRDKSGSAAYVLWPEGARKLLVRAERGAAPVDAFLHGLRSLGSFQIEPALGMQLHLLAAQGLDVPAGWATAIQAPRKRLAPTPENLPFHARRLGTQVALAGDHLMRLFGRRYRRVDVVRAEMEAALAALRQDQPSDQTRS